MYTINTKYSYHFDLVEFNSDWLTYTQVKLWFCMSIYRVKKFRLLSISNLFNVLMPWMITSSELVFLFIFHSLFVALHWWRKLDYEWNSISFFLSSGLAHFIQQTPFYFVQIPGFFLFLSHKNSQHSPSYFLSKYLFEIYGRGKKKVRN